MNMGTKIEWTYRPGTIGESWNPIQDIRKGKSGRGYHCTKCSPGCDSCWAENMNNRFGNRQPFDNTPVDFEIVQKQYERPLHWRKARTVSVQLMGDLFHEEIAYGHVERVLQMIDATDQHTYLLLTKRPARMYSALLTYTQMHNQGEPLPNLWAGVSICTNEELYKLDALLDVPAVVPFVSIEPMLGEIDLQNYLGIWTDSIVNPNQTLVKWEPMTPNLFTAMAKPEGATLYKKQLAQVIVGAETGPGARPMDLDWARSVRDQCLVAGVAFFFKRDSAGNRELDGRLWEEFPG